MIQISFILQDNSRGEELDLNNLDLGLFADFFRQVQDFLRGSNNQDLSEMKIGVRSGSATVLVEGSKSVLSPLLKDYAYLQKHTDLSRIDSKRAKIIKSWQETDAVRQNKRTYQITHKTRESEPESSMVAISQNTSYKLPQLWVDVELYLYGHIYDMGGKNKSNVHMELENGDSIIVEADQEFLAGEKENHLYKKQLIRVKARQNIADNSVSNAKLISFESYNRIFNQAEYKKLAEKGAQAWKGIKDIDKWIEEGRGNLSDE